MFRPGARVLVDALVVVLVAARAQAKEWPEFRGPTGQGHAGDRGVPSEWSEASNVAWKTPIPGLGWSSPVVGGGRVWLTTATGDREVSLRAVAYDVETGREVVNVEVFRLRSLRDLNPKNSWASPTPILEGDRVYGRGTGDKDRARPERRSGRREPRGCRGDEAARHCRG